MPGTMPWQDELSAFMSSAPRLPVCIVTASNNQSHIKQAFKLGVKGYIRKTSTAAEVKDALFKLVNGGRYVPRASWDSTPMPNDTASLKLTRRQKEILTLIAAGDSNKKIGEILDISESTVKRHAYNLFKALKAKNRTDAVQIAKNQNLLASQ